MNITINKEFLYGEYITKNKSRVEIAQLIHRSPLTVHRYLKKYGLSKIRKDNKKLSNSELLTKKYGLLTPIKFCGPPQDTNDKAAPYRTWVECKCDCGNITIKPLSSLIASVVSSCGCLAHRRGYNNPNYDGYKEISGKFFSHIKRTAMGGTNKRKRICKNFDLSIEFLWNLYIKQNKKCALSGMPLKFGDINTDKSDLKNGDCSLDRIDSSKGYTEDNVQWVYKKINIMKNNFDQNEFIELCRLIATNNQ